MGSKLEVPCSQIEQEFSVELYQFNGTCQLLKLPTACLWEYLKKLDNFSIYKKYELQKLVGNMEV